MPFISGPYFRLVQTHYNWTHDQMVKFLEDCQYHENIRREWTPQEQDVAKFLRTQPRFPSDPRKISYGTVAKILHRSEKQVYAYLNNFTPLKISQTIQEKQSRGAQWLGEMIEKKFHLYKIVREHILYQKNTRHIKGCHYNYPAVRLDYYLPKLHIGFEYDGPQHDRFVEFFHKDAKGFRRSQ